MFIDDILCEIPEIDTFEPNMFISGICVNRCNNLLNVNMTYFLLYKL